MHQGAGTTGRFAGVAIRCAEVTDLLAVAMEHERADRAGGFQTFVFGELSLEDLLDVRRERERARLAVLGRVRVQPDTAPCPVDIPPFQRQDFTGRPPAGGECEPDDVREGARRLAAVVAVLARFQRSADFLGLVPFEKSPAACCAPSTLESEDVG